MIPFIGLTGGIGAGKSTALDALERLGAATLSTDRVVHELYESPEVRDAVAERFGPEVLRDGAIDRAALARLAFASRRRARVARAAAVAAGRRPQWSPGAASSKVARRPPRAAVVEVPLLFEVGDGAALRRHDRGHRRGGDRHQRRVGAGHQALDERAARQLTQEEKSQRATYTVVNDGTVAELERKLSSILDMLHK